MPNKQTNSKQTLAKQWEATQTDAKQTEVKQTNTENTKLCIAEALPVNNCMLNVYIKKVICLFSVFQVLKTKY